MNNSQNPLARKDGLVVQEMPEEVLVYDLETNKAHCLNRTAAFVWKSCTGENSIEKIAADFRKQTGKAVEEDLVWLALDQLNDKNLLAQNLPVKFAGQSRRAVLKKIGFASVVALPVVASLVAPTAVLAVACSGAANGTACTGTGFTGQCCSGQCCNGFCNNGVCQSGQISVDVDAKKKK